MLPAALRNVATSPHYSLIVKVPEADTEVTIPCQKVIGLVKSTRKSQCEKLFEGFKLITEEVEDMLSPSTEEKFVLLEAALEKLQGPPKDATPNRVAAACLLRWCVSVVWRHAAAWLVSSPSCQNR